jgi:phage-related baseplate assembly protein
VNVHLLVQVADSADPDQVLPQVEQIITDYFDGNLLGKGISRGKLYALAFQVDGVEKCTLMTPNKDLDAQQDQLPVLGTLNIEEWDGES